MGEGVEAAEPGGEGAVPVLFDTTEAVPAVGSAAKVCLCRYTSMAAVLWQFFSTAL